MLTTASFAYESDDIVTLYCCKWKLLACFTYPHMHYVSMFLHCQSFYCRLHFLFHPNAFKCCGYDLLAKWRAQYMTALSVGLLFYEVLLADQWFRSYFSGHHCDKSGESILTNCAMYTLNINKHCFCSKHGWCNDKHYT